VTESAFDTLVRELHRLLVPFLDAGDDPLIWGRILRRLGWDGAENLAGDLGTLARAVKDVDDTLVALTELDSSGDLNALLDLIQKIGQAIDDLQRLPDDLANAITTLTDTTAREALAADVVEFLALSYISSLSPVAYRFLRIIAIIRDDQATAITSGGTVLRSPVVRPHLALDRLGEFFDDPAEYILEAHGIPAGLPNDAAAEAVVNGLLREVEGLIHALGGRAMAGGRDSTATAPNALRSFSFVFSFPIPVTGGLTAVPTVGATIEVVPASRTAVDGTQGPAVQVQPLGVITILVPLGGWLLELDAGGSPVTIVIDSAGIHATGAGSNAQIGVSLGRSVPLPALGPSDGPRVELGMPRVRGELSFGATGDIRLLLGIPEAKVVVQAGSGDGFLSKVLPSEGITIPFGFTLAWSRRDGVTFEGGVGLELKGSPHLTLFDVLRIDEYAVSVRVKPDSLRAEGTVSIGLALGPLKVAIEQIGIGATFVFPANGAAGGGSFGLAGPRGAGFSIKAGPVSGGGYLFFDPDKGEYAGALQLQIKVVNLTAIGLLTTKLPGGQPGFSLLVIITASFPPIQLGYGFTLNGVGGLVGINRTMVTDALRDGARNGSLEGILFPSDPVANIVRILADLRAIFPPAEGRYVFGPMVMLGWGPNSLIEIQVALVLELPSPLRLAILGRVRIALPTKEEAVIDLRLDVVGILDFDRQEASIDASLVDSRLAVFTLTGDMAFRLGWGATKMFVIAAGGFNPRFTPPTGFPVLRRLGIALATSDNPSIRLEMYFALTANTLQFGANAEIYAKADTVLGLFSVSAHIGFDALVEFQPLHFIADIGAGVEVARNNVPWIHAVLAATLEGPTPWHASGFAEVEFCGKHRIAFEVTSGTADETPARVVDLGNLLRDEVGRKDVWSAVPPAAAATVSVRDATGGTDIVVHPLGSVTLHQRVLPFGKRISRFGAAIPQGGDTNFALNAIRIGNQGGALELLFDDFSPGQFENLTDDQKIARPAFESMQAGGSPRGVGLKLPTPSVAGAPPGELVELGFEELIIDDPASPSKPLAIGGSRAIDATVAARLRVRPDDQFRHANADPVRVKPERFVLASADTLDAFVEVGEGTSAAQANDSLGNIGSYTLGDVAVVGVHEAA
jgi:hypothetical protein